MSLEGVNGILNVESAALHAPQVGIANTNPQHILSVGSNLYVSGDSSNVLTVDGNVVCEGVKVGLIEITPSYDLGAVSNVGNTTSNIIQFTNATTGFVTTANIEVGTANLFVDTVNSRVGVGTLDPQATLHVNGDAIVTGNLTVSGTTTTIDTQHLRVTDPLIELGKDNLGTGDLGLVMTRPTGSSNVAIIFDENADTLEIGYTDNDASATDITMVSTPLSVNINGDLSVTSNLEVGTANLFVDTVNSRVGIGTTAPTDLLDVHYPNPSYGSLAGTEEGSLTVSAGAEHSNAAVYFRTPFDAAAPAKRAIFSDGGSYSGGASGGLHFCLESTNNNTTKVDLTDSKMTILHNGNVGIGVTDPDSKLEVRGNIRASLSDTNHGMFIDAGGTILRDYDGANGSGLHFTTNAIWPTNYLGDYSAGGIDLGSSSYRWNNIYTEALSASGTVTASTFSATSQLYLGTSASIRQTSSAWTGSPGSGVGKIEYHSNRWYIVAGSDSTELLRVRRNDLDKFIIDNNGSISQGIVPAARISGTVASASAVTADSTANRFNVYSSSYAKGYSTAALEIREYNLEGATGGTEWERAPRIGFHWGGRVASQIIMDSAGTIICANDPGTGYERLRAGPIEALGEFYTNSKMRIQYDNPTINFQDTNHNAAFVHNNSNLLYILRGDNNATTWTSVNGQWPFVFNLSNNDATCGGNFTAVGNVTAYSDIRHKRNIVKIEDSLNKVHKLSGYTYNRKDNGKRFTGLIAQEVQEVLPEAVNEDTKGELSVAYGNMTGLLVEAIKELTAQLNTERERVDVLSKKLGT
jgi:hypothetical protein